MYSMNRQSWHFLPVPVLGARHVYEMCADGLVRKQQGFAGTGECRWQLPHEYSREEPVLVYRLFASGRQHILPVTEIFALYGVLAIPRGWIEAVRLEVRLLNQKDWQESKKQEAVLGSFHSETATPAYTLRSCPWQTASIAGDCQGADPVLGF